MLRIAILTACAAITTMAQTMVIQPSAPSPATETRTFGIRGGGTLEIFNVVGEIKISAWSKDEITLRANFTSNSDGEHVRIEAQVVNNFLGLIAKYPEGRNKPRAASCKMELNVPGNMIIDVSNDVGTIVLENVSGNVIASTITGNISGSVKNIEDNLEISTVTGDIKIKFSTPPNGNLTAISLGKVKIPSGAKDAEIDGNTVRAKFGDGNTRLWFNSVVSSIDIQ